MIFSKIYNAKFHGYILLTLRNTVGFLNRRLLPRKLEMKKWKLFQRIFISRRCRPPPTNTTACMCNKATTVQANKKRFVTNDEEFS